jgi:hypothetical protein
MTASETGAVSIGTALQLVQLGQTMHRLHCHTLMVPGYEAGMVFSNQMLSNIAKEAGGGNIVFSLKKCSQVEHSSQIQLTGCSIAGGIPWDQQLLSAGSKPVRLSADIGHCTTMPSSAYQGVQCTICDCHNAGEGTTPRGSRLSTEGRRGGPFPYDDVMQVPEASQAQQAGPAFSSQPTICEEHRDGYADSQGVLL